MIGFFQDSMGNPLLGASKLLFLVSYKLVAIWHLGILFVS